VELSNLIQPAYFGVRNVAEVQGENVFVLYWPGGDNRPYSAPVSLSKNEKIMGIGSGGTIQPYRPISRKRDPSSCHKYSLNL